MLRRCGRILKTSTALERVVHQTSPNSLNRIKVEVADNVLKDFKRSATDAPDLLEVYEAPQTSFFSEKRGAVTSFQLFTTSFLIGGATIAGISLILNNAIEEEYEQECLYADGIKESNERHAAVLEGFVAPSSYKYLVEKMNHRESQRSNANPEKQKKNVFHNEVLFRAKVWWNRQLTLIDSVLSNIWAWRRLRLEEDSIRSALTLQGYELVRLKKE